MLIGIIIWLVSIGFGIWSVREFAHSYFRVHKTMNENLSIMMPEHNDLNRFLEEFEQIKSELVPSRNTKIYNDSLFHKDFLKDFENSMNGQLFRINNVRYVAKNFSDYRKATKVIKEHFDYCVANNLYSEWMSKG